MIGSEKGSWNWKVYWRRHSQCSISPKKANAKNFSLGLANVLIPIDVVMCMCYDSYQVCCLNLLLFLGRLRVALGWRRLGGRAFHPSEQVVHHLSFGFVLRSNEVLLWLLLGRFFDDWSRGHNHSLLVAFDHWRRHRWGFLLLLFFIDEGLEGGSCLLSGVGNEPKLLLFLVSPSDFLVLTSPSKPGLLHKIIQEGKAFSELRLQVERVPHCGVVLRKPF